MFQIDEMLPVPELRVVVQFGDGLDRAGRDVLGLECAFRLVRVELPGPLGDGGVEFVLVRQAALGRGEAFVAAQVGALHDFAQRTPLVVGFHADGDPAVFARGLVHAVRGEVQVAVAHPRAGVAVHGLVEQEGRQEVQRGLGLGQVDVLAVAGLVLVFQRGQDGRGVVPRRNVVGVRAERAGRVAVGPAGRIVEPGHGRGQIAEPGEMGVRPGLPHQAGAQHDDVGLDPLERFVIEAPLAHGLGGERLGHHVGPAHQVENDLARLGFGQVEGDRQLARVHVVEQPGTVGAGLLVVERADHAHRVEPRGGFHAHDGRAVVGQNPRRARAGHGPHEVEDFHPVQRLAAVRVRVVRHAVPPVAAAQMTPSARSAANSASSMPSSP